MKTALEKAVEIVGGQTNLALHINVTQAHVWGWINRSSGKVPGEYCIDIARATAWKITPHELRPDIYPHPRDGLPEPIRCAA